MSEKSETILAYLRSLANPANTAGMARFGINPAQTLGVSMPTLREVAKETGKDHALAAELWASGVHEARILASLVDDSRLVDKSQMETWALDLDSWDVCDQLCNNLLVFTPYAVAKAEAWSQREETFVKRAGFVLMAALAVHAKTLPDEQFARFLTLVGEQAGDPRNFVKKAVNWSLRQIGKRNPALNRLAIQTAEVLLQTDSKPARWVAADALRELNSGKIQARLK